PRSSDTLCAMGFMLSSLGRFAAAARLLEAAQSAAPQDPTSYRFQSVNTLRWTGNLRSCLAKLNKCPESVRDPIFYLQRGDFFAAGGDARAAAADFERAHNAPLNP